MQSVRFAIAVNVDHEQERPCRCHLRGKSILLKLPTVPPERIGAYELRSRELRGGSTQELQAMEMVKVDGGPCLEAAGDISIGKPPHGHLVQVL
jgi:hypothetical protein